MDLEELRSALAQAGYEFDSDGGGAAPDPSEIREELEAADLTPSRELVDWLGWVEATGALTDVMPGWAPVPVADGLAERAMFLQVEEQIWGSDAATSGRHGDAAILLADPIGGADKILVNGNGQGAVFLAVQTEEDPELLFDSVSGMVRALTDCWRDGGYVLAEDEVQVGDADAVVTAWQAANPVASASGRVPSVLLGQDDE